MGIIGSEGMDESVAEIVELDCRSVISLLKKKVTADQLSQVRSRLFKCGENQLSGYDLEDDGDTSIRLFDGTSWHAQVALTTKKYEAIAPTADRINDLDLRHTRSAERETKSTFSSGTHGRSRLVQDKRTRTRPGEVRDTKRGTSDFDQPARVGICDSRRISPTTADRLA